MIIHTVIGDVALVAPHVTTILVPYHQQYSSIGSDNGLAPRRRQAIICTNDGYLLMHDHSASMSLYIVAR